eukprot:TRINITY_DN6866_c0_g1_i1.p1 TRINITY_DN6866_c0_g1~~TRINITY_DN6866_c0_g1_i1.p1  ORF type:complete len:171 (-),score=2.83 TRINITY_DN6866_c0_g1_i1:40-552(-)
MQEEKVEALADILGEFCCQAACGVQISAFRALNLSCTESSDIKMVLLCQYLNGCFESLVQGSDPFVTTTFAKIHQIIPDESPLCLMHLIKAIAESCINLKLQMGFSSTPTNASPGWIDVFRNILTTVYTKHAKELATKFFRERPPHNCSNFKFTEVHSQDPSPIWTLHTE